MWPFGSSAGTESEELTKDLPDNLKGFFAEENAKHQSKFEESPKDDLVAKIVSRQSQEHSHDFARYKRDELLKKVTSINCAELQQAVIDCYKGWLFTSSNHCSDEIQRSTKCIDTQNRAFRQLRYEDCYNEKQCKLIRYIVDKLFVKNFGQFGEDMSEENHHKFDEEVESVFTRVWK